jgi:selenium metabolism protein YedF
MACPLPVVTVKRALEEPGTDAVTVFLDDGAPRENVARFARSRGYEVIETVTDTGITLVITRSGGVAATSSPATSVSAKRSLLVTSDRMGDGPEDLGRLLMKNFIITLLESSELPDKILFVNTGVFLATEGSDLLEALEKLGNRGVEVLSCGVCLDFFGKRDAVKAGSVTNMFTIVETLMSANGTVRL